MADQAPTPQPAAPAGDPTARFIGLIFISIGVLWLALTGLCTMAAFVTMIGAGGGSEASDILLVLAFAVPSAIMAAAVYGLGRLLRPRR